jgi:transposase-like protein
MDNESIRAVFLPKCENCFNYLRKNRWRGIVRCPFCFSTNIWRDGTTSKGAQKYHCQDRHRYFNDLTGLIINHHKLPLEEMFYILKEIKSTYQIANELGRKYDSILHSVHEVHDLASLC